MEFNTTTKKLDFCQRASNDVYIISVGYIINEMLTKKLVLFFTHLQ